MKKMILLSLLGVTVVGGLSASAYTGLHRATIKGDHKMVKALVEKDKVDLDAQTEEGNTALHIAGKCKHRKTFNYLIEKGASTYVRNKKGETPAYGGSISAALLNLRYLFPF